MRFLIAVLALAFSSMAQANTYNNCKVENLFTHDHMPNLVTVTLSCNASDAMTTGGNCVGTIRPNAFIFDSSNGTGKNHLALVLTAMAAGNSIYATTYGACPATSADTLWLYALKIFKN